MLEVRPQFYRKDIRSYVIRRGRMTPAQEKALSEQWPTYGLDLHQGQHALDGAFTRTAPVVLELGFGMGDSLLEMATNYPHQNFIGIEVHVSGVGRLVNEASKLGLDNLKIFCADGKDVLLHCIPENSLERFQLFFPDPWHKSRHHKRRLVQPEFVDLVVSRLRPGGLFHMATDWIPYAEAATEVLAGTPSLSNCATAGQLYCDRPTYRPLTKFEKRGANLGHSICDLIYMRAK